MLLFAETDNDAWLDDESISLLCDSVVVDAIAISSSLY